MAQYLCYMSAFIWWVFGLIFLLASCTESTDGSPKPYTGPKIAVKFTFAGVINPGSEVVSRSTASSAPSEEGVLSSPFGRVGGDFSGETAVIPLTEDLYMYATLEVDQDINLRTNIIPLNQDVKLRIVAYENGTDFRAFKDYTIDNNGELVGDLLQVDPGEYKFVAYSYNSTTLLPIHDETLSDIDPVNDLLWGFYPEHGLYTVTATSYKEVPITMSHMFSQMRIQATTTAIPDSLSITGMNNVRILPDYSVNLTVENGALTQGNNIMQSFTWPALGSTTVYSAYRTVYTHNTNPTSLQMGSIILDGNRIFNDQEAIFNKQMQSGISYTLRVSFQKGDINKIIITVVPNYVELSYAHFTPAPQTLTVTAKKGPILDPTLPWTLTSNQNWLWLSLNADGSGAAYPTISGTGSQTVYLVVGLNTENAPRYAEISLNDFNNPVNVVTNVKQNYFNGIGEPGSGIERIYIDDNGYDPKLMLTQDPANPGAFFQFGGIRGWKQPSGRTIGNASASYNPSHLNSAWNNAWTPDGYTNGYVVVHTVASLRNGTGDPCRLVGYTQSEILKAIDTNNRNAYAPDNQVWRLPTGNQLLGYTNDGYTTSFPRYGYIYSENDRYLDNGTRGYYWSSWQSAGGATYTNAGLLQWTSNSSKVMWSLPPASAMSIRCVSQ